MTYAVQKVRSYSLRKKFTAASFADVTVTGGPSYSNSSLVGWWRLNTDVSSTGDVTDASGNSRDGTFAGAANRPAYSSALYPSTRIQAASYTFSSIITAGSFEVGHKYEIVTVGTTDWEAIGASASPWEVGEQFTATGVGAGTGTALSFDETINVGTAATWDAIIGNDTAGGSTQQMSFSMWVYKTGDGVEPGNTRILDFGGDILVAAQANDSIIFKVYWTSGIATWTTPVTAIVEDTWAHVVITYDGSSVDNVPVTYIDGVAQSLTPGGTTPSGTWRGIIGTDCFIGSNLATTYTFEGNMADVAVWNRILTADDVSVLYNAASYDLWLVTRNWNLQGSSTSGEDIDQFSSKEDGEFALSINPFRQGINADEMKYVEMGLTPKISAGTRTKLILNGVDMSAQKYFDDAVISNSSDVKLISGSRKEVPNFEMEPQNFGQAKLFNDDVPYLEMQKFNAVSYLTDDTGAMVYPYVGSNPAAKDPYQNDGVIEPLYQIRQSVSLMTIDFPFLAQGVRGTMQGEYATDSRQGGVLITQQINNVTSSLDPYEDSGVEYFGANSSDSVALPGFLTEQQARMGPWVDDTFTSIHIKQLQTGSQDFTFAMEALSGTNTQDMLQNHHRSATAGFVYDNNTIGTDSIAFGGWKK